MELFMFDSSTWTHLTVCKQVINIKLNCNIARYGYEWNGHIMSIKIEHIMFIEHRNIETWKTLMISQFRYETFYYLWV